MIASSIYELDLKCLECVNLHTKFHKDSSWGRHYFNVYINDLPRVPYYCSLESYVDDSKLHLSFLVKDMDGAARQITEDLRKVAAWCCQHSLLINPDKTKLLLIGTRQMLQNTLADLNLHVTLLGKELRPVVSAKDLGVYMDATLSFDENLPLGTGQKV